VTLTYPGGCEIYVQLSQPDGWLELDGGRFRGHAAHLRLDSTGRLLDFCAVGGLELEWQGRLIWRSNGEFEDIHLGH
jgi:hypothetical protein